MKRWWLAVAWFGCVAGAWGETPALVIREARLSESGAEWSRRSEYFVDQEGYLSRLRVSLENQPGRATEIAYLREGRTITWVTRDDYFEVTSRMTLNLGDVGLSIDGKSLNPINGDFAIRRVLRLEQGAGPGWTDGRYRTRGEVLSSWVGAVEYHRVALERRPSALTGTVFEQLDDTEAWTAVRQLVLGGQGLKTGDPLQNIANATLIQLTQEYPLWPPFVFEKDFLKESSSREAGGGAGPSGKARRP